MRFQGLLWISFSQITHTSSVLLIFAKNLIPLTLMQRRIRTDHYALWEPLNGEIAHTEG